MNRRFETIPYQPVRVGLLALLLMGWSYVPTHAFQQALSFEAAAKQLQTNTLTIRVGKVEPSDRPDSKDGATQQPKTQESVSVFTGVAIGNGMVVSPLFVQQIQEIRLTLAGGEQRTGRAVVLDEYSGLALIKVDNPSLPGFQLADERPEVGSWVLSAAAWGVEKPVVSYGIVGGVDRRLVGTSYPPMLLCDMRTAATSWGSPIVDPQGHLLGIVVAATDEKRQGWTYAVPSQHIRRLLRAYQSQQDRKPSNDASDRRSDLIVMQRQRPVVGMVLDSHEDTIVVSKLAEGGPAAKAGLQLGDQIIGVEGVRIRSVYQAVIPTFNKQPGEIITFQVRRGDKEKISDVPVVLGGGATLGSSTTADVTDYIQPKIQINDTSILLNDGLASHAVHDPAVSVGPRNLLQQPASQSASTNEKIQLLERAIANYQATIIAQKTELLRQAEQSAHDQKRIDQLEQEIKNLKQLLKQLTAEDKKKQ